MADTCIKAIPDIAGIGIRVNFYTTIFVSIFTREKDYTEELLCGIYKNSIINGLGLLFTAVIQTVQGKLDLYHALIVMCIMSSFNAVFLFGERRFVWSSQTNFQMFIYLLAHAFGVIVFLFWFFYIAFDGSKFGSQPSCNDRVNFVLFFSNIRATVAWFRIMMIVFYAVTIPLKLLHLGFLILAPVRWTDKCTNALQNVYNKNPRLGVVRYLIGVPLAFYIIASLELMIYRNRSIIQPGENDWGFGQIIAIILTLGMFIDIVAAIRMRNTMTRKYRPLTE